MRRRESVRVYARQARGSENLRPLLDQMTHYAGKHSRREGKQIDWLWRHRSTWNRKRRKHGRPL